MNDAGPLCVGLPALSGQRHRRWQKGALPGPSLRSALGWGLFFGPRRTYQNNPSCLPSRPPQARRPTRHE
ncbi:hypothetical protein EBQ34_00655 [Vandammella animalimorsus]|uniref:Uncharacterized protein n=1 Tax=Vandammella animalimorsus TaxID=2029117 RepID=A0A3M6RUC4_9BURK|nr:hypothetical protein EBQ34_00655 [Vandammella animalimorsus]